LCVLVRLYSNKGDSFFRIVVVDQEIEITTRRNLFDTRRQRDLVQRVVHSNSSILVTTQNLEVIYEISMAEAN